MNFLPITNKYLKQENFDPLITETYMPLIPISFTNKLGSTSLRSFPGANTPGCFDSFTMLAYEMQTSEAADEIGGVSGSGPATNFRDAATEGVGMWGPIMGGVVVVGGAIAVVGTLLHVDGSEAS